MSLPLCYHKLGVTKTLLKSTKRIECPACGFRFSLMYSRAIACQGCPESVLGCEMARCLRCDHEFSIIQAKIASGKVGSRRLANYLSRILSEYSKDFGEK